MSVSREKYEQTERPRNEVDGTLQPWSHSEEDSPRLEQEKWFGDEERIELVSRTSILRSFLSTMLVYIPVVAVVLFFQMPNVLLLGAAMLGCMYNVSDILEKRSTLNEFYEMSFLVGNFMMMFVITAIGLENASERGTAIFVLLGIVVLIRLIVEILRGLHQEEKSNKLLPKTSSDLETPITTRLPHP